MLIPLVILFFLLLKSQTTVHQNNVCKHLFDYLTIKINPNCWYNPDVGADTESIVTSRGYPFEIYETTTEDGYVITLFRIRHNKTDKDSPRQPVLMQPGLCGSSVNWFNLGENSLPFVLANNGFDVWLANIRGSIYAKGHIKLDRKNKKFWDYTFHDIAIYDLPAEIDLIANVTGMAGKIIYLGYSMGSTESFIYAILRKEHAKKNLAGIIALTPIAYLKRVRGVIKILSSLTRPIDALIRYRKIHVLFEHSAKTNVINCNKFPGIIFCKFALMLAAGFDPWGVRYEDLPVFFSKPTSATPIKLIYHYNQGMLSGGKFQQFDYGPIENLKRYNSIKPPSYNVSQIDIPVHLLYGNADFLSNPKDVIEFYKDLKVKDKSLTKISDNFLINFNHVDFVLTRDVKRYLYIPLLKIMKKLKKN